MIPAGVFIGGTMFGFGKQKTTHDELGAGLFDFAVDFSKQVAAHELSGAESDFAGVDELAFIHEWMILLAWAIHRAPVDCEKGRLMRAFFKTWISNYGIIQSRVDAENEQRLIAARLKEYDGALKPSTPDQLLLGGTIAKNILGQEKLCLDAGKQLKMATHALLLIKEVRKICDKYQITD
jgi:hypothetical protein